MIVDTSALVAILFREPEAAQFGRLILGTDRCRLSVASYVELFVVLQRQGQPSDIADGEALIKGLSIEVEPITREQGELARHAFHSYGRGRHKAKLNFGDCFAYALAKATDEPLLFKGSDFLHTDVRPALQPR